MFNVQFLEEELLKAIEETNKYERENDAKFRAIEQRVATYDEFRDIVRASHLKPLEKKEKLVDPDIAQQKRIWNTVANKTEEKVQVPGNEKRDILQKDNEKLNSLCVYVCTNCIA